LKTDDEEKAIRAALRARDPRAVAMIWDAFAADLLAVLQGLLCHQENAEDCLQRLFVKIVGNPAAPAGARRLRAYLVRMARNEAYDWIRRHRKRPSGPLLDEPWLAAASEDRDLAEQIAGGLERLPEQQRLVLILKVYRDKTFAQIGAMLKCSPHTAASRYRYGLRKMKTILEET
jgi:RNA polymerase sigma-70 factor (ECF subfamily)